MSKDSSKERMKALETAEEKRQRRLNKKVAKNRKAMEKMGWDEEYRGYTNSDNPFGDEFLLETCVWRKKLEKEGQQDLMEGEVRKMQKMKMIENKRELEKVKKRRMERETERAERENEQEVVQRDKEAAYFRQWEQQEDSFHLQQAKLRSKIRVEEGRAKPIDLLAQYINCLEEDDGVQVTEPYHLLHGLSVQDLDDLMEDIKVYLELEEGRNADFWRDITMVTEEEVTKLKKLHPASADLVDRRSSISHTVMSDIEEIFKGKSLSQLNQLQSQIQVKLKGGEGVDVGYWENLSDQLRFHMARQRLRERHQELLRHKLYKLKQEQCLESQPLFPVKDFKRRGDDDGGDDGDDDGDDDGQVVQDCEGGDKETNEKVNDDGGVDGGGGDDGGGHDDDGDEDMQPSSSSKVLMKASTSELDDQVREGKSDDDDEDGGDDGDDNDVQFSEDELSSRAYLQGRYSPQLLSAEQLPAAMPASDWTEEMQRLHHSRKHVLVTGQAERDEEEELMRRARRGMDAEEAQFSVQVDLPQQESLWSDKYRPRKPRFFNRVHTGFEWNKYNQTHYDIDNPPPKIVQGYKFNIFYPDLIDKSKAPEYKVIPCEDNKDFGVLRFTASAPYEDIAFKIVNREWEQSSRRGFRCQYQNNILQLWFHFKRFRYRR